MSPSIIQQSFDKLYGVPSWHVQQGFGSFLTFDFGTPRQEIGSVINPEPNRPGSRLTRMVTIRGDWHLWIFCCGWRIIQDGSVLATFESSRESISAACAALNGQALSEVGFQSERGECVFRFDLGGMLSTAPYDEDLLEQWILYCPDSYVLTYRSDGAFSYGRSDTIHEEFSKFDDA